MGRRLNKAIFIPAVESLFVDSGEGEPRYIECWGYKNLPKYIKIINLLKFKKNPELIIDRDHERNFRGSFWKAIEFANLHGYKIIFYPERGIAFNEEFCQTGLSKMQNRGMDVSLLERGGIVDLLDHSEKLNINTYNSALIVTQHETVFEAVEYMQPRDKYKYSKENITKPLGFRLSYWGATNIPHVKGSHLYRNSKLPTEIRDICDEGHILYSNDYFPFLTDKIVYIDYNPQGKVHNFIKKNLNWIKSEANKKDCCFVYISSKYLTEFPLEYFDDYFGYYYPALSKDVFKQQIKKVSQSDPVFFTNLLLEWLKLPMFKTPALLRGRASISGVNQNQYSVTFLDVNRNLKKQFRHFFSKLQPAYSQGEYYFYELPPDKFDRKFEEIAEKLTEEVISRVQYLKDNGMYTLLAEIALRLFNTNELEHLSEQGIDIKAINIASEIDRPISRLRIEWITKFDFQIVLPEYGNLIVEMTLLPKALYYLFLMHPEGIRLNSLADHTNELFEIYARISNKSEIEEIKENVRRLTDPLDNSVHVNLSRIKNAFVKVIDDQIAKNYYITGYRGERKKIILDQSMIEIVELF